ncbi:MAG: hypothetical protein ACRC46_00270 [Thermoguttaceae bacterium]
MPIPTPKREMIFRYVTLLLAAFVVSCTANVYAQYGSLGAVKTPAPLASPTSVSPSITSSYTLAQATTSPVVSPAPVMPSVIAPPIVNAPPIDPYATTSPGSTTLFAKSGIDSIIPQTYEKAKRFRDRTSVDFLYIAPTSSNKQLGVTEVDLRCQFAIPLKCLGTSSTQSGMGMPYLYLAPGAAFDWFKTPSEFPLNAPSTYSAYLDVGVQPHLSQDVWLDAWVRVGVASDYKKTAKESVRVMGRVMGMFRISSEWDGALGVIYLNRERVKLLPSGGLIWHPNADTLVKLTFPDPKISKRFKATSDADFWVYLQGSYGGGVWTMTDIFGTMAPTDYNDIRLGIGLELESKSPFSGFQTPFSGFFEFGGAFGREFYREGYAWSAENSWYLRAGIVF